MISPTVIQLLTQLSYKCAKQNAKPEEFAIQAAILATKELSSAHSFENSDAATFVAAFSFLKLTEFASQYSASLMSHHELASVQFRPDKKVNEIAVSFLRLAEDLKEATYRKKALQVYKQSFDLSEKNKQALITACSNFMFIYSVSYSAYIYALSTLPTLTNDNSQPFKKTIEQQLNKHFLIEPLSLSFFMQVMTSPLLKTIACALLLMSLAVLAIAITGLVIPAIGAAILSTVGLSSAFLLGVSSGSTTASSAYLAGGFFSKRKQNHVEQKRHEIVEHALCFNGSEIG
ncbi:hypothetical protein [Legionella impletisoli]|uniref:Uncharacterized protein n=1 Tax=Legionella impletisoli TaxID=343510 RepID=A0A917JTZ6_9GAMM|nr:hypothetical protein [Legionella impletisoli]GGI84047.1 hypothetical protein GCM10007966_10880 [Legionella impletisoli]